MFDNLDHVRHFKRNAITYENNPLKENPMNNPKVPPTAPTMPIVS